MGEATETASDGGPSSGDGGAGDAREVRRGCRAAWSATQHTAARRRVWAGRAPTNTSPLSASRADEKQFPASTEQVRERRAGMGGRGERRGRRRVRAAGRGWQEGRAAAEGDAVVGAHGRAAAARRRAAALRDGPAPRAAAAARQVTKPRRALSLPYHAYIPLSGRPHAPHAPPGPRVPDSHRLDIYLLGGGGRPRLVTCAVRSGRRATPATPALRVTPLLRLKLSKRYNAIKFTLKYVVLGKINSNRNN